MKCIITLRWALAIESRVPANLGEIQEDQRPLLRPNLTVGSLAQRFAGAPRGRQVARLMKELNLPVPRAGVHVYLRVDSESRSRADTDLR
jgi:hypothetical protein